MPKPLVIVESPAKARTIAGYLGKDFVVEPSVGHIRDLPRSAADVPPDYKGQSWARLGVDVDHDFKPLYIVPREKKDQVAKLKKLVKEASELYLATDEDREGESIAWHLFEVLQPKVPVRRMVFHEITRGAIQKAIAAPRDINRSLVDAQETRRLLDRLYGYETSPVLWKKIATGLSAGRVQSVATRIVVERERERMRFRAASYWDVEGTFSPAGQEASFAATLVALDGKRLATGKDFTEQGQVSRQDVVVLQEAQARSLAEGLSGRTLQVRSVERKPYRRRPAAPFMTSTLQQEAGRKLRMSSAAAMRAAQSLYESGFITYMRTDSTTLSETALTAARTLISERFGAAALPDAPRQYTKKVKNAQEAHEAIRPAGDRFRDPAEVAREVGPGEARLYELIWQRTVASQMNDAVGETVTVRLGGKAQDGRDAEFATSGTIITSPGYQQLYEESRDEDAGEEGEKRLPALAEGAPLDVRALEPSGHTTSPPARYTEASLVKRLEELGVGRPSTYAATIERVQDVGYVWKKGTALVPSFTAFAVVNLLERHFPDLVDYSFTARMEDDLDEIANGKEEPVPWLRRFYFGEKETAGLQRMVTEHIGQIDAIDVSTIPLGKAPDGQDVSVRVGRYGPSVVRGEQRVRLADDIVPDELTLERALALLEAPSGDRELGVDPKSGLTVLARAGRFGPYVQLGIVTDPAKEKPPTASLFKTMALDTVTLEEALRLLSLPRVVGKDAEGNEIVAMQGRYGPYLKKGNDSRSLGSEEELFTVTSEQALALFAQKKERRGRGQAAPPLKELGNDPVSGKPIVVKEGRFGAYVTDGETNASLRKGDRVEEITTERAAELMAERRLKAPEPKKKRGIAAKRAPKAAAKTAKAAKAPKADAAGGDAEEGAPAAKTAVAKKPAVRKAAAKKANA